jgi:hypothetical protein
MQLSKKINRLLILIHFFSRKDFMIVEQILGQNMDHYSLRVLKAKFIKRSDDFIKPTPIVKKKKKEEQLFKKSN